MTSLVTNPNPQQLNDITSPEVLIIIKTIKAIQKRLKDDDVKDLEYIRAYDKLSYEFNDFFERYTNIFVKIIRGDDLKILASTLYYKDQIYKGLITEEDVSKMLAEKYLPANLNEESKKNMKDMKDKGLV